MLAVITVKRKKELEASERRLRELTCGISESYRWLSGFDWLLKPMWEHVILGKHRIEQAREYMEKALEDRDVNKMAEGLQSYMSDTLTSAKNKCIENLSATPAVKTKKKHKRKRSKRENKQKRKSRG